jgi:hypothetical protein
MVPAGSPISCSRSSPTANGTRPSEASHSEPDQESLAESQRKAATQIVKVLTGGQPDYPVRP